MAAQRKIKEDIKVEYRVSNSVDLLEKEESIFDLIFTRAVAKKTSKPQKDYLLCKV